MGGPVTVPEGRVMWGVPLTATAPPKSLWRSPWGMDSIASLMKRLQSRSWGSA